MKNKINWMKSSLAIIFIVSLTYTIAKYILGKYFNLLFRDWVWTGAMVISILCILIIEIIVLIKLNKILEENWFINKIWKTIIQILCIGLIVWVNFYGFFLTVFGMSLNYEEIGVETHNGQRYVVRNTAKWLDNYPEYYYHQYKNFFVYDKDIKYWGQAKWEDYLDKDIQKNKDKDVLPNIIEEDTGHIVEHEEIKISPSRIEYIQKMDENLDYGFYLVDRAGHQYSYAFIQSNDKGLSWQVLYQFPANSEIYYGYFLDREMGFVNFGSSEGLSVFMTRDSGLTWQKLLIVLEEENKNMLYVQDIKKNGQGIEITLGPPSWSGSEKSIKYISLDKGLSWDLQR